MLLIGFFTNAQTENDTIQSYTITVTIPNVVNDDGSVLIGLHNSETFMKGPGVQNLQSEIKDGKVTFVFKKVPTGEYAIMAMHDKNDNKQMDMENGMPQEDYGMTGTPNTFGPPVFNDAKFTVKDKDLEFTIRF
tara:strand:- start:11507 stop:11908 length:402 start_codon:yes stop_codon:yes gene_type:complete